ncbi:MAG: hypothetical protein WA213_08395, partial [Terriglobales bacterium]
MFVPAWVELAFGLARAAMAGNPRAAREALSSVFASNFNALLTLTLLAHQTLLSVDAVVRALVRRLITRERLLEWETAAEAELGKRATPIDRYLNWVPFLAIALGLLIWRTRPQSLLAAVPILALWASSKGIALWLNASPIEAPPEITRGDKLLLRRSTLYIWRYFAEFSNEEHNWLIPDNVQDDPRKIAASVSPTNVGLLLNARQVAAELGYLTLPEMVERAGKTLDTVSRLTKYRGHLMNWYDTHTLEPKPPFFISSVDSGNLVASLWTLQQGCVEHLHRPFFSKALAEGFLEYLRALVSLRALSKRVLRRYEAEIREKDWLTCILEFPEEILDEKMPRMRGNATSDVAWFREQAHARIQNLRRAVQDYMPWCLPEFAPLRGELIGGERHIDDSLPLEELPDLIVELETTVGDTVQAAQNGSRSLGQQLKAMLPEARQNSLRLIESLSRVRHQARELANQMDFSFLLDKQRQLLSVGFDAQSEELQPYCYDVLATEPRTAVFVAIAK